MDTSEYQAALKAIEAMRNDTSKEGKATWKRFRSAHGLAHFGQYLHEAPNLMFHMLNVIPEIMHLDGLNVAKQAWTKGLVILLNEHLREVLTGFVKGLGAKLDVKTKPDGRAGSAWFKASVWAQLVNGTDNVPSGLPAWLASVLWYVGVDFVGKQKAFVPRQRPEAATSSTLELLRAAFGNKGQQILECAELFDAYKDWHDATHLDTPTDAECQRVALKLAITANRLMIAFKTVAKEAGKTWVYHISLFIVPRTVRKCVLPNRARASSKARAIRLTVACASLAAGGATCGNSPQPSLNPGGSASRRSCGARLPPGPGRSARPSSRSAR